MDAITGQIKLQFPWRKAAKDSLKTLLWSPDERICLRLVPPEQANQPNSIEVYLNGQFE